MVVEDETKKEDTAASTQEDHWEKVEDKPWEKTENIVCHWSSYQSYAAEEANENDDKKDDEEARGQIHVLPMVNRDEEGGGDQPQHQVHDAQARTKTVENITLMSCARGHHSQLASMAD